jgi:hypothetical protein
MPGIIVVSCVNVHYHQTMHESFLAVFMIGVAISAIFTVAEYRYLDKHHSSDHNSVDYRRLHGFLKKSYIFKTVVVSLEIALAIAFGVVLYESDKRADQVDAKVHNVAAILEWLVSFVFTFYLLSFAVDLWPARRSEVGEFHDGAGLTADYKPRSEYQRGR